MPQLGDIKRGTEVGFKTPNKVIWAACRVCGKARWVKNVRGAPQRSRCLACRPARARGDKHAWWKGGKVKAGGYYQIKLQPDDFFYPMVRSGNYVFEHRLVIAKSLGRNLQQWEIVHHKNGIKTDNRIENLQLVSDDRHKQITILEMRIKRLEKRVTILEAENALLKAVEV